MDLLDNVPGVVRHDLRRGLPFADEECDAVYHSHVLEHLTTDAGRDLLVECHRVLRAGGIVRVVVPDLERIARDYLHALENGTLDQQEWMRIELLDQMVRVRSGGDMARFVRDVADDHKAFVRSRIGNELFEPLPTVKRKKALRQRLHFQRWRRRFAASRQAISKFLVRILEGEAGRIAFEEAMFRQGGEIHRWMYDRRSLSCLLLEVGFEDVHVVSAAESSIKEFDRYELDSIAGEIRKPDSLFIEAIKPTVRQAQAA